MSKPPIGPILPPRPLRRDVGGSEAVLADVPHTSPGASRPSQPPAIGPAPADSSQTKSRRRRPLQADSLPEAKGRPTKQTKSSSSSRPRAPHEAPSTKLGQLDISGVWFVRVKELVVDFVYDLHQHQDGAVTGHGSLSGQDTASGRPKVTGRVQGYVFTWTEETGGKFRATLQSDGQALVGTCTLNEATRVAFEGTRSCIKSCSDAEDGPESVISLRDASTGESVRCPRAVLVTVLPGLVDRLKACTRGCPEELSVSDLLSRCPLEQAAKDRFLPLLRGVILGRPEDAITRAHAIHALALMDWMGCSGETMGPLMDAARALSADIPSMLGAADMAGPSVAHVLRRGLLIRDAAAIDALASDASRERWCAVCGRAVLQRLLQLAAEDPDALRLSPAASAALRLGLPPRDVHAVVPAHMHFGPGGTSLVLDLKKREIGPEGAARLELPRTSLEDVELDFTRCNIRAVGAASLRFPAGLQRLRLILRKCDIGPEGAKSLSLPASLTRLDLDLSNCLVGPAGAAGLRLPAGLLELELSLLRCAVGDRGARSLRLPAGLRRLRLNLARCAVGSEGMKGLQIPPRLTALSLDLTMCHVGADGLRSLLLGLPTALEALELELCGCGVGGESRHVLEEAARKRLPALEACEFRWEH